MKKRKAHRSLKTDLGLILRGYRVVYELSPQNFIWSTISIIANQFSPYFTTFMSAEIINQLIAGAALETLFTLALITETGQLL